MYIYIYLYIIYINSQHITILLRLWTSIFSLNCYDKIHCQAGTPGSEAENLKNSFGVQKHRKTMGTRFGIYHIFGTRFGIYHICGFKHEKNYSLLNIQIQDKSPYLYQFKTHLHDPVGDLDLNILVLEGSIPNGKFIIELIYIRTILLY